MSTANKHERIVNVMSYYIVIRGPAGVGKSTVAQQLSQRLNGEHVSIDDIMKAHKTDCIKGECIPEKKFIEINNLVIHDAKKKLDKGKIVVFDGNFYHKSQLKHLTENLLYPHYTFTLQADLQTCLSRNKSRKRSISEEAIKDVYKLVSKFNCGIRINTNKKTYEEIVKEIMPYLH